MPNLINPYCHKLFSKALDLYAIYRNCSKPKPDKYKNYFSCRTQCAHPPLTVFHDSERKEMAGFTYDIRCKR